MKTLKIYFQGWQILARSLKLSTLVYLIFLISALLLAIPFYRLLISMGGNSLLPDSIVTNPDISNLIELLLNGGKSLRFYTAALWPWLILFFLLNVLLQGGILTWVSNPRGRFTITEFFSSSFTWFWPFLRIALYFIVLQLIVAILCYLPAVILTSGEGLTDKYLIRTFAVSGAIHLFLMVLVTIMADMTRFIIFQSGKRKPLKMMWKGIWLVFKRFPTLAGLYLMWGMVPVMMIAGYILLKTNLPVTGSFVILLLFILQQLFIWIRYNLRVQRIGMFYRFYLGLQVSN